MKDQDPLLRCVTCAARFEHYEDAPTEAQKEQRGEEG